MFELRESPSKRTRAKYFRECCTQESIITDKAIGNRNGIIMIPPLA